MGERFNELYQLYKNDIYRLAYSYLLNEQDSEDVIQKVYIKLYNNKKILTLSNNEAKRWLFRICINESKDILKSPWKKLKTTITNDVKDNKTKDDSLVDALYNINPDYRIPLYLFYYEGYSTKEMAELLHIKENNVRVLLNRARNQLRKEIEADEK